MTGYMWNVNWITKFRIIWPCVYFWKRRKKDTKYCMYICSVSNTLCLIYFYSTKKKFSTKAYISWQYRKKYIFPCFALVTVVQVGILEGQEVNCGDARYRKKQQLSFWEPLLKTEVIFAFVYHGGVYFCMAARLSTDAMPFWDPLVEKNCHGQKLLLRIRCSFSCYTFTDDRLLIGSLAKLPGWKKR